MNAQVLCIEDDPDIALAVRLVLRRAGLTVIHAASGEDGLRMFQAERPEVVLLDVGLPAMDGWRVLERIRAQNDTPVMMLTAHALAADQFRGLHSGADDYLVKPFSLEELAARIRALLRRDIAREDNVLRNGELALDTAARTVTKAGAQVDLSAREFALLAALLERPGNALSKAQLEEKLYGWGEEVESNTVEVHVHNLRKKLGADAIRTIRGVGYVIAKS